MPEIYSARENLKITKNGALGGNLKIVLKRYIGLYDFFKLKYFD